MAGFLVLSWLEFYQCCFYYFFSLKFYLCVFKGSLRVRSVFHVLAYSPIGCNGWGQARRIQGQELHPGLSLGAQAVAPTSIAVRGISRELDWSWSGQDSNQHSVMPASQAEA